MLELRCSTDDDVEQTGSSSITRLDNITRDSQYGPQPQVVQAQRKLFSQPPPAPRLSEHPLTQNTVHTMHDATYHSVHSSNTAAAHEELRQVGLVGRLDAPRVLSRATGRQRGSSEMGRERSDEPFCSRKNYPRLQAHMDMCPQMESPKLGIRTVLILQPFYRAAILVDSPPHRGCSYLRGLHTWYLFRHTATTVLN